MAQLSEDLSDCTALVVDGNPNSRSILVAQLRDLGLRQVLQATRTINARKQLETQQFDFVLCEMRFADESISGQDLLDDLRRNYLLPFHTVFIMITSEATYTKVAEAAESAMDGYLLKPHKASHLAERLFVARSRKRSLQAIFDAIDGQQFERAAAMCVERFESKGLFWLYAARVGAELLLRMQRFDEAQTLYQTVVDARQLPWAKLGIARTQLESGRLGAATTSLDKLISEDASFADAYDMLARAQFELGQFDKALQTYKAAYSLTPASISRMQSAAMMAFYAGEISDAGQRLDRTVRAGMESRMFDMQSMVLFAFTRLGLEDRRGLQRCLDDCKRLVEKDPESKRNRQLTAFVEQLNQLQRREINLVTAFVEQMAKGIQDSEFNSEIASNLLALLAQMRCRSVHFADADRIVQQVGMRFCSNRAVTELLAASGAAHPPYAQHIRAAQASILEVAETAMSNHRAGDTRTAVTSLIAKASETLNVRLIDNAFQLLLQHGDKLPDGEALKAQVLALRTQAGAGNRKVSLGNQRRQAGGVMLRTGSRQQPGQLP